MTISRSLASYTGACLSVYLQALDRGMKLPLRGAECVLCEDGLTVMIEVPAGDDWIMASFELPEEIDDAAFDPRPYVQGFAEEEG
jgi:hypothetical protein